MNGKSTRGVRAAARPTRRAMVAGSAALLGGAALAACGATDSAGTAGTKTSAPISLRFLASSGSGEVPMFEPLVPMYMEERPNVKVELEVISDGGWNKVNALLVADSAPDVSRVNDDSVYYWGSQGKLLHLDPYVNRTMKRDAYFPPEWQAMSVDGKLFSLQPHFGVNLFVYNKSMFARAGVAAPTDWAKTWDWQTFVTNLRKLATPNAPQGQEAYGAAFPVNYLTPLVWGNGGRQYNADETKCIWNSKEAFEILQEFQDLMHVHRLVLPPGQSASQLFSQGRLAMNWGSPGFGTQLPPEVQWDLMPTAKSKKAVFQEGYVRTFGIPASTKDRDAAFDLLKWLLEMKAQVHLGRGGYGVPALKAASDPVFKDGPFKEKNWKLIPDGLNYDVPLANNPIADQFKNEFTRDPANKFMRNELKAREFLDQGCQQVDNKIRELNWKKKG
ncbi:MAG: sugar ABC transporter substrate-binding protein [Chloroflexi bacterium]|nr:sugar ABC transporter substrate-binding protein [Chloroflexota bacterium]